MKRKIIITNETGISDEMALRLVSEHITHCAANPAPDSHSSVPRVLLFSNVPDTKATLMVHLKVKKKGSNSQTDSFGIIPDRA